MLDENKTKQTESNKKEFENSKIPAKSRKGLFTLMIVMLGFGLFPSTISAGAEVASNFNFGIFLIIIFIGNIFLMIYALLMSFIGLNSNVSLHNMSKRVFGKKGYKFTSLILVISQIGWFGVGIMMVSQPLMNLLHIDQSNLSTETQILTWIAIIIMGALITSAAFFGVKALEVASLLAIPIVLISGLIVIILSLVGGDWGSFDPGKVKGNNDMSFFFAIGLVISTFISGATVIPDFMRWAKNKTHVIIVVVTTFLILQTLLLLFGAMAFYGVDSNLFSRFDNQVTLYTTLSIMGLMPLGFIALFANVWTSNDNSLYSTGLAVSSMFKIRKSHAVIILGTIGTLLAPIFASNGFIWFLSALGYLIPGIGSIMIFDYYIFYNWLNVYGNEEYFYFKSDDYDNYKYIGFVSWILGILITLLFQYLLPFIVPVYIIIFTGLIYVILEIISIKYNRREIKDKEKS